MIGSELISMTGGRMTGAHYLMLARPVGVVAPRFMPESAGR